MRRFFATCASTFLALIALVALTGCPGNNPKDGPEVVGEGK